MAPESGYNPSAAPDIEELRQMLSPNSEHDRRVEAMLAIGLGEEDLLSLTEPHESELHVIGPQEEISDELLEPFMTTFSVTEEDARDWLETHLREANEWLEKAHQDGAYMRHRTQRVLLDLSRITSIFLDHEENLPLIVPWLTTANHFCNGERPLDRLKIDPVQVQVAAASETQDTGRISDLYGHM